MSEGKRLGRCVSMLGFQVLATPLKFAEAVILVRPRKNAAGVNEAVPNPDCRLNLRIQGHLPGGNAHFFEELK